MDTAMDTPMDSVFILVIRIAMLAVLWLFVLMAVRAVKKSTDVGKAPAKAAAPAILGKPAKVRALDIVDESGAGHRYEITGLEEITLGRSQDATIYIQDGFASSRHAVLFKKGSEWFVEDLSSRNGTFVDDYQIDQPEKVGPGSVIRIGRTFVKLVA